MAKEEKNFVLDFTVGAIVILLILVMIASLTLIFVATIKTIVWLL